MRKHEVGGFNSQMKEVATKDKRMYFAVRGTDEEDYVCTVAAGTIYVFHCEPLF